MNKNTMLIEVTKEKAVGLLRELEELHLIRVLKKNRGRLKLKMSDKYKGIIIKKEGLKLNEHIKQTRNEWTI